MKVNVKYHLFKGRGFATEFISGVTNLGHGPSDGWYYGTVETDGNMPDLANWQAEVISDEAMRAAGFGYLIDPPKRYVRKLLILQRLAAIDLAEVAIAALKSDEVAYEMWSAAVEIDSADPQVRAMLTAIGADPDEILKPEEVQ